MPQEPNGEWIVSSGDVIATFSTADALSSSATRRMYTDMTEGILRPRPIPRRKQSEDDKYISEMVAKVERGESIGVDEYRKLMRALKRSHHIDRDTRRIFHKLQDDGDKTMSAVSVDDLVPA